MADRICELLGYLEQNFSLPEAQELHSCLMEQLWLCAPMSAQAAKAARNPNLSDYTRQMFIGMAKASARQLEQTHA